MTRATRGRRLALLGVLALALAVGGSAGCSRSGGRGYAAVRVQAGSAATVSVSEMWRRLAEAGGVGVDTSSAVDLTVDYAPDGTLVHFRLQAISDGSESLTVGWEGFNEPDPAKRTIFVSGTVVTVVGTPPRGGEPVARVLDAVDRVGAERLIEQLPVVGAGGYYSFAPLRSPNNTQPGIDPRAPAVLWRDARFVPLGADDPLRSFDNNAVYLIGSSMAPAGGTPSTAAAGRATVSTAAWQSWAPVFFVIPE
jgi:hypothetical protein